MVETTHHKRASLRIKRVISVNARDISKTFAEKREPPNQREEMSLRTPTSTLLGRRGVAGNFSIFKVEDDTAEPAILIHIKINGSKIPMELDTGAILSVM